MKSFIEVLNEQVNNSKRIYWRGGAHKTREEDNPRNILYLTTDISYAWIYAHTYAGFVWPKFRKKNNIEPYIQAYRLNGPLNIFNAKSEKDLKKLNLKLNKRQLKTLKDYDWEYLAVKPFNLNEDAVIDDIKAYKDKKPIGKTDILEIIMNLGYDGFFNWERNNARKHDYHCPAIGLFNENSKRLHISEELPPTKKATYIRSFNKEELLEIPEFKKFYKGVLEEFVDRIMTDKKRKKHKPIYELDTNLPIDKEDEIKIFLELGGYEDQLENYV
jgi:hypothetical protein